jgi:hypothetical protein
MAISGTDLRITPVINGGLTLLIPPSWGELIDFLTFNWDKPPSSHVFQAYPGYLSWWRLNADAHVDLIRTWICLLKRGLNNEHFLGMSFLETINGAFLK